MTLMRILTRDGVEDVELRTSEARSAVGSYWNAVQHFLSTGEVEALDPYQGTTINGRRLLTDPDEIERLARIGELDLDDIYQEPR
jgi:hypothetical protein